MTFADELMLDAQEIWQGYYDHPFVQGMIDGTLDKEKFCRYLVQDTNYLVDYAKVYAWAFAKADNVPLMRHVYMDMDLINSTEGMMHIQYLKGFGLSEEQAWELPKLPGCRDYVNYMLRIASEGSAADAIMAAEPCALSYYKIGCYCLEEAKKRGTAEGNFFMGWIEEYSGEGYKAVYDSAYKLLNIVAEGASEKEKARFKEIFRESSKFETGFWDMSYAD